MVIACTNAKPAIVAPAAIAYSAPLVAAAAPVAPLPFVTATSSQVVRISVHKCAPVQLLIIIYRSNRCVEFNSKHAFSFSIHLISGIEKLQCCICCITGSDCSPFTILCQCSRSIRLSKPIQPCRSTSISVDHKTVFDLMLMEMDITNQQYALPSETA